MAFTGNMNIKNTRN